jgi:hypothetical protein
MIGRLLDVILDRRQKMKTESRRGERRVSFEVALPRGGDPTLSELADALQKAMASGVPDGARVDFPSRSMLFYDYDDPTLTFRWSERL